jgi:hypothetical protein
MRASIGNAIKEVIKTTANNKTESAASKKTTDLLKKLQEKKYEDNHLKELERKRFQEAKQRLKDFVLSYGTGTDD